MEHVDCLLRRRVVSVIEAKPLNNSTRLNLVWVDSEELRDCVCLLGRKQTLSQFHFAEVRLIHFSDSRDNPQWELFGFAEAPKPLSEALSSSGAGCFLLSSHTKARYDTACHAARIFYPRGQVEDLATPFLRGEAELRGEGRDCLESVRRRVNPTTGGRAWRLGSFRPRRIEQATREVAQAVNDANDVEGVPANAVENEMLVERLLHEEQPNPGEPGVSVIRFLSNPRMAGQQPHRSFDRIGETLRQSDTFPLRIIVCLQGNVGE